MIQHVYLVPLLPLIGFIIIGLFGKNLSKGVVGTIGSGVVLGAFAIALGIFFELTGQAQKSVTIDLFNSLISVDFELRYTLIKIANPTATSAAATAIIKNTNTCPLLSDK